MPREISKSTMRNSDRAWVTLASGVATYNLIAGDDEQLSNAARRCFKSQPIGTASMIRVTGLRLVAGIPPWPNPIALIFAAYQRRRSFASLPRGA
jgi:hypothetical protein